jgi:hypothetical protein
MTIMGNISETCWFIDRPSASYAVMRYSTEISWNMVDERQEIFRVEEVVCNVRADFLAKE